MQMSVNLAGLSQMLIQEVYCYRLKEIGEWYTMYNWQDNL